MKKKHRIPKIIHFCWFGGNEKPEIIKKCLKSWNENLSDYEFKEWNEENFDMTSNPFVQQAYEAKKFAFVSDFVRVYALYHYGGIYLDTDVEVFKSFDNLLHHDSFWGFEQENFIATSTIGAAKGNQLIKIFLDAYRDKNFKNNDGTFDELTNVAIVSRILEERSLKLNGEYQEIENLGVFYPQTYFSPFDYINYRKFVTENTYAIHHFHKSWLSPTSRMKSNIKKVAANVIGGKNIAKIRKIISQV